MNDNEDYIPVVGKMPRFDNDGREVTNEILGAGGARRDDGTLSAMVDDLQIFEEEDLGYESPVEDSSLLSNFVAFGLTFGAGYAIAKAKPKVEQWWKDSAQPELKKRWDERIRKKEPSSESEALESLTPVEVEPSEVPSELSGGGVWIEGDSELRE